MSSLNQTYKRINLDTLERLTGPGDTGIRPRHLFPEEADALIAELRALRVQPDPERWPECSECGVAWVLRRALKFPDGFLWVWQLDCKHKKAAPRMSEQ